MATKTTPPTPTPPSESPAAEPEPVILETIKVVGPCGDTPCGSTWGTDEKNA